MIEAPERATGGTRPPAQAVDERVRSRIRLFAFSLLLVVLPFVTAPGKIIADTKAGTYEVFTGPISDQSGKERIAKGQRMEDKDMLVMDWYVKGVQS